MLLCAARFVASPFAAAADEHCTRPCIALRAGCMAVCNATGLVLAGLLASFKTVGRLLGGFTAITCFGTAVVQLRRCAVAPCAVTFDPLAWPRSGWSMQPCDIGLVGSSVHCTVSHAEGGASLSGVVIITSIIEASLIVAAASCVSVSRGAARIVRVRRGSGDT